MFSYYGSKSKIVDVYPPPKFDKVIEPFAGSARYALKYWQKEVLLVDKYDMIVDVWNYLKEATEKDILNLPKLGTGDSLRNYNLSKIENDFMGFLICAGSSGGRMNVGSLKGINVEKDLIRISKELYKIRHWKIVKDDYINLKNKEATWFIDPPYMFGGQEYKCSNKNIDFNKLGEWCKSRRGQTIVCENTKADWLPFKPMKEMQGTMFKTVEAIWSNLPTNFDNEQQTLF